LGKQTGRLNGNVPVILPVHPHPPWSVKHDD